MIQCTSFPTKYERIESDALRAIGITYQPFAEGAPGDTIRANACFAGDTVDAVTWQLSYNHIVSVYGSDTIADVNDLPVFNVTSSLPDSVSVSFVIPDSVFYLTKAIAPELLAALKSQLPSAMSAMTQRDMARLLNDLSSVQFDDMAAVGGFLLKWGTTMGIPGNVPDSTSIAAMTSVAGKMLGVFSVPGVLFATAHSKTGRTLKIKSDFTIRYNSRFQNTEYAQFFPVNRNPAVHWVGVYKVKNDGKDIQQFNPADAQFAGKYSLSYLYNDFFPDSLSDTVVIEKGYSYFLGADSGTVSIPLLKGDTIILHDSARSFSADTVISESALDCRMFFSGTRFISENENWFYDWQFQNMTLDSVTMPLDSLLLISGMGNPIAKILPSLDEHMTHARIWVTVFDQLLGELNRPIGFAIRSADLYFRYAE
jgi:hypothetical protein